MNSQLTIALHILGFLAARDGGPLTSETLARSYGTSPVVLRRVLTKLQRAGLVETRRGSQGGSVLARNADQITIREAYQAVNGATDLLPRHPDNSGEGVAPILSGFVNELLESAEAALLKQLEAVTIAQMDQAVRAQIIKAKGCRPDRD